MPRIHVSEAGGAFCPLWRPWLLARRLAAGTARLTPLGLEKRCPDCGDFWPADTEFFFWQGHQADGMHCYCKACYMEKRFPERYGLVAA